MNVALSPILAHLKQELTDVYGDRLLHLTLFGSQARGDAEPGESPNPSHDQKLFIVRISGIQDRYFYVSQRHTAVDSVCDR